MTDIDPLKRRRKIIERLLKNWQNWGSLVESEGLFSLTVDGEDYHYLDMLTGLNSLPPRQRQAVFLMCVEDRSEHDTARIMGFDNPLVSPCPQYKSAGIIRLIEYLDADSAEQLEMIHRVSKYGHTVRKKRVKKIIPTQEEAI
jgi:hypothetical protein